MASGSLSSGAFASWPQGGPTPTPGSEEEHKAVKISRAMRSGPYQITKDAKIVDLQRDGTMTTLREGANHWVCFPGNENEIGNVPMCCDPMGLKWMMDAMSGKPAPTNAAPGLIYMLCGATQHSNTDPLDKTSPAIPIGPHWMITWPYDSKRDGIPNTVRDNGAWVMFDGTPYAYLHICGTPWSGNEYQPEKGTDAVWTIQYAATP
jgi:hypothetical protein